MNKTVMHNCWYSLLSQRWHLKKRKRVQLQKKKNEDLSDTDDIELQQSHLTKNMMWRRLFISIASYFLINLTNGVVGQTVSDTTGISLGTYNAKTSSFSKCQLLGSDYYNPVSLSCKVHDSNSNQDMWMSQIVLRKFNTSRTKQVIHCI